MHYNCVTFHFASRALIPFTLPFYSLTASIHSLTFASLNLCVCSKFFFLLCTFIRFFFAFLRLLCVNISNSNISWNAKHKFVNRYDQKMCVDDAMKKTQHTARANSVKGNLKHTHEKKGGNMWSDQCEWHMNNNNNNNYAAKKIPD